MWLAPFPAGRRQTVVAGCLPTWSVIVAAFLAGSLPAETAGAVEVRVAPGAGDGTGKSVLLLDQAPPPDGAVDWMPPPRSPGARADTIDFGFYELRGDGLKYAVRGGSWTWDHGAADPLEGWTSVDLTTNDREYWRWMTASIWAAEGNPGPWPQMNASTGIVLCGASEPVADTLGWVNGVGYGNEWCQRLVSPQFTYDGSGEVLLSFHYFNDTDTDYDYSKLYLQQGATRALLNDPGFNGRVGIDENGAITQQSYTRTIAPGEFVGGGVPQAFWIAFEFQSDGSRSDQDGASGWNAFYGALGVDDVVIAGANLSPPVTQIFEFDSGLQGWTAEVCPGAGALLGIAPLSSYLIQDPCQCRLAGSVLEMHDELQQHPGVFDPVPQHEVAYSCAVDRRADIGDPEYLDYNRILAEWDQYSELSLDNCFFYRPGWSYYPYANPQVPGLLQWSPRVGQGAFYYAGMDPLCTRYQNIGTDWGLPPDCDQVKFLFEVIAFPNIFHECYEPTNFTPIIDNVRIRNTHVAEAPTLSFEPGGMFQDGFGSDQIGPLSSSDPGWANSAFDTRLGNEIAVSRMGDSLVVKGPAPDASTRWEAKLWLRLKRAGPAQSSNATYIAWRNAWIAARGIQFTPPQSLFTWGHMDSMEAAGQAAKNKFCSQFRDGPSSGGGGLPADLMYSWGPDTGEQDEGNEMVPDLALTPGTKVEYFITANYICTPNEYFHLPDTSGGNFLEFEVLPSMRLDGGPTRFPCLLYIDADNLGSQPIVESALNVLLNGATPGVPIPDPTRWDRYDYLDASASWRASFYREYGGSAGGTIPQLLGYRAILIDTGSLGAGSTLWRDWFGIQNWLTAQLGEGNIWMQAVIAGGSAAGAIVNHLYPQFLHETLGASHLCVKYADSGCPPGEGDNDQNVCVRVDPVPGSVFGSDTIPTDLFGNWCPAPYAYGVLDVSGTGVGNKNYVKIGSGTTTQYAQVITDHSSSAAKYRSCIQNFSFKQMTARDADFPNDPNLECPTDSASRVTAAIYELRNSLKWALNISNLGDLGLCVSSEINGIDPDPIGGGVPIDRLYPARPNPFNPRTTIRFSLAAAGDAKLVVYDVTGRQVRTLIDGTQTAGLHEVIWDGQDDGGHLVPSGVYWTRLSTGSLQSNRKMVVLK